MVKNFEKGLLIVLQGAMMAFLYRSAVDDQLVATIASIGFLFYFHSCYLDVKKKK